MLMPMERTKAVMRILNSGSLKPPKNPTTIINNVARSKMAGMTHITCPNLPVSSAAATTVIATRIARLRGIQWVQVLRSRSQRVSFSGGVRMFRPYFSRLSST